MKKTSSKIWWVGICFILLYILLNFGYMRYTESKVYPPIEDCGVDGCRYTTSFLESALGSLSSILMYIVMGFSIGVSFWYSQKLNNEK